jgi:LacI family transcriptional regulator
MEAIAALMEHGLKVPEDISIIGFDDNPQALYGPIGLTTIQQPLFSMAETAVRELHAQMSGKSETLYQKVLEPTLIVRDSCAPLTT